MSSSTDGKKIVSGMIWRFGEKITAQGVSFIVSVILARILMPKDYGIVAIVNIFIAIAEVFVTSGLGTALIQKKDATQKDFSTVFWFNLAFSVVLYILFFFVSPLIALLYHKPLLTSVLRVCAIRIPINAVNSIQNAYVSRHMDFKKFFFATIIGTVISAVIGIWMAYRGFGVWALIAQMLTNTVIDTIVLFLTIKWRPTFEFSFEDAKPLINYGWKILATDLIGTVFNQLNAFIIGKKYSEEDLAYYSKGKKFPDIFNNNLGATLASVLFPAMSLSAGIDEIKRIRRKSMKMMEYVVFPIMFIMCTVADNMIRVLLTDKWMLAVPFVRIACIAAMISVLGTTLIQEIKAIGRSDITLKMELIKKPLYLVIALIAMQISVEAIAYTLIITEIIAFCVNVYPVRKYIGFDFKMHLADALPPLLMSAFTCLAIHCFEYLIANRMICLIAQVVLGGGIYIVLSIITKNESYRYLVDMIHSKLGNIKQNLPGGKKPG